MLQNVTLQPVRVITSGRPRLAQEITTVATSPQEKATAPSSVPSAVAVISKPAFIDSALLAFTVDVMGTVSTGILAYAAYQQKSRMAMVLGLLTGGLAVKGLIDLSRIRER